MILIIHILDIKNYYMQKCQICFHNRISSTNSITVCNNCKNDNQICVECWTRLPNKSCPFCKSPETPFWTNNTNFGQGNSDKKWYDLMNVKLDKCNHELSQSNPNYKTRKCNYTQYPLRTYCLCHKKPTKSPDNQNIDLNYNIRELLRYAFIFIINLRPHPELIMEKKLFLSKNNEKINILKLFHAFIYSNIKLISNKNLLFDELKDNFISHSYKNKKTGNSDIDLKNEKDWCKLDIFWTYDNETNTVTYLKNIF
tara:strand:+ start:441 stop:1205 length:765 start_codon:yes stop_codon:yes gene_type:complete